MIYLPIPLNKELLPFFPVPLQDMPLTIWRRYRRTKRRLMRRLCHPMSMGRHEFSVEAAIGSAALCLGLEQESVNIEAAQSQGGGESRWDHYTSLWEV